MPITDVTLCFVLKHLHAIFVIQKQYHYFTNCDLKNYFIHKDTIITNRWNDGMKKKMVKTFYSVMSIML